VAGESAAISPRWPCASIRQRAHITVENLSDDQTTGLYYQLTYALTDVPDDNAYLHAQWDAIIHHPFDLSNRYEFLWEKQHNQERTFYDLVRARFNQTHRPYYLLYWLARCVKASVRYNANGEFNQSPDNRRKGRKPADMRRDILSASALLQNTLLMSYDYQKVLELATPEDIIYMDPPSGLTQLPSSPGPFSLMEKGSKTTLKPPSMRERGLG
jgi:site-specific DNA-adenine methylase